MAGKVKCKSCGRDFVIQGVAFGDNDNLKTARSKGSTTEERCTNCAFIATYNADEIQWEG